MSAGYNQSIMQTGFIIVTIYSYLNHLELVWWSGIISLSFVRSTLLI